MKMRNLRESGAIFLSGGVVGGGMAHGVMATVLLPAVFAVILGCLLYRLAKRHLQTSASQQGLRAA